MREGRRVTGPKPLTQLREDCLRAVAELPASVRRIRNWDEYEVVVSEGVRRMTAEAEERAARV
jgi:hypothetical protein